MFALHSSKKIMIKNCLTIKSLLIVKKKKKHCIVCEILTVRLSAILAASYIL